MFKSGVNGGKCEIRVFNCGWNNRLLINFLKVLLELKAEKIMIDYRTMMGMISLDIIQ